MGQGDGASFLLITYVIIIVKYELPVLFDHRFSMNNKDSVKLRFFLHEMSRAVLDNYVVLIIYGLTICSPACMARFA